MKRYLFPLIPFWFIAWLAACTPTFEPAYEQVALAPTRETAVPTPTLILATPVVITSTATVIVQTEMDTVFKQKENRYQQTIRI